MRAQEIPAALAAGLDPAEEEFAADPGPAERAVHGEPREEGGFSRAAAGEDEDDADDAPVGLGGHADVPAAGRR